MIFTFKSLYLSNRFFMFFSVPVVLMAVSFAVPWLYPVSRVILAILACCLMVDYYILFRREHIVFCVRHVPKTLSLADENTIKLVLTNTADFKITYKLIDELPVQLQIRDFFLNGQILPGRTTTLHYAVTPKTRGAYLFRNMNIFVQSALGLVIRRIIIPKQQEVPVFPSVIQMKKFELHAITRLSHFYGIKKIRKIGHSYEFDHIKNYVIGDDTRSINWKASSRQGKVMVNHYEDERSQQIYSVIDKSRVMKMPFNGLSLLDFAINTSLVISNVAIQKHDKAGLITFSDSIDTVIKADNNPRHMQTIIQALYRQSEHHLESNYELFYKISKKAIRNRGLLFLFTNFESVYAMQRALPILRRLNAYHLLVVIFFENTELIKFAESDEAKTIPDIYSQTMARKFIEEKNYISGELAGYGIQIIKTKPENLSLNVVNKYLELKSRGLI